MFCLVCSLNAMLFLNRVMALAYRELQICNASVVTEYMTTIASENSRLAKHIVNCQLVSYPSASIHFWSLLICKTRQSSSYNINLITWNFSKIFKQTIQSYAISALKTSHCYICLQWIALIFEPYYMITALDGRCLHLIEKEYMKLTPGIETSCIYFQHGQYIHKRD